MRVQKAHQVMTLELHSLRELYETFIPIADRLYDAYIAELRREGLLP